MVRAWGKLGGRTYCIATVHGDSPEMVSDLSSLKSYPDHRRTAPS